MITKYSIQLSPLPARIEQIKNAVMKSDRSYRFYGFKNEYSDLPVIKLDLSVPVYRMENYRTRLVQLEWLRDRHLPDDYFLKEQENESAQQHQHEFLWKLANQEKKNIANIIDTLSQEGQKEPILITDSGIVVNGNRRLSAMREIFKSDPINSSKFLHVDCMVLPSIATEQDLKIIEVQLQMTPETRLPYDWIVESIAIQDLKDRGLDPDIIANYMRIKDPGKIKIKLRMLAEVDMYLKEWKNTPGAYSEVMDAEQIMMELTSRFMKKEGTELELARRIGWILLDQRGKDGRIYNYKEVVGELLSDVSNKIQETYPLETKVDNIENNSDKYELFLDESPIPEQGVIEFLKDSRDNERIQESILQLCSVVVETKKQQKNGLAAFKAVNESNTKLISIELSTADPSTFTGIKNQLLSIVRRSEELMRELDKLNTQSA